MSAPTCASCKFRVATVSVQCEAFGCFSKAALCPTCAASSTCAICEKRFCDNHITRCGKCNDPACYYCVRKLPADPTHYDLNCFDTMTSSIDEMDVIATCPLTHKLPAPDFSIFKKFDPPIEVLPYSRSKTAGKKGARPKGVQAEHFVPNSSFIDGTGRTGTPVFGMGGYTEGKAPTYWVDDDQKAGTEHKYLTDRERTFCSTWEKQGKFATLKEWLDYMQAVTVDSLLQHRDFTGVPSTSPSFANEELAAAQQAAHAIRYQMEQHFAPMGVDFDAFLCNGLVGGVTPPKTVTKSKRTNL